MASYQPVPETKQDNNEAIQLGVSYHGRPIPATASSVAAASAPPAQHHVVVSAQPVVTSSNNSPSLRYPEIVHSNNVRQNQNNNDNNIYGVPVNQHPQSSYNGQQQQQQQQQPPPVAYAIPVAAGQAGQQEIHGGMWPTPLCGCFENCLPSCMMAWCLWPYPLARVRVASHIDQPSCVEWPGSNWNANIIFLLVLWLLEVIFTGVYIPVVSSWISLVVGVTKIVFITVTRMEYRRHKGITENCCCCEDTCWDDCCSTTFCMCCVIAQMDRTEFNWRDGANDCGRAFQNPRPDGGVRPVSV